MRRLSMIMIAAPLLLAGCGRHVNDSYDPFKPGSGVIKFELSCSAKTNQGECLQYTCKANSASDCSGVASGCVKGGNHYAGTAEGGKCTKVL